MKSNLWMKHKKKKSYIYEKKKKCSNHWVIIKTLIKLYQDAIRIFIFQKRKKSEWTFKVIRIEFVEF